MSLFDKIAARRPAISTRRELDDLKARRAAPSAEPHLRPDGPDAPALAGGSAVSTERRIRQLENGFAVLKAKVETEHRLTALKGRTRQAFDRER